MRERLYLTYDSKKDKAYTHNWINRAVEIDKIPRYKLDIKYVKRLCSALSYSSLFLLPEHMLYNGAKYTIPEICIRYQGIVASELYRSVISTPFIDVSGISSIFSIASLIV